MAFLLVSEDSMLEVIYQRDLQKGTARIVKFEVIPFRKQTVSNSGPQIPREVGR
ncbi:hypothetical protein NMG60_11013081 [Bertholletia excelsa]